MPHRPLFAIREIGSSSDALPPVKDFERWPSEMDIASKGDPQYAYSTYRSLGSNLATLGFNMNLGPVLAVSGDGLDPASSFGSDPLQAGVFAKTFILGHREENVIAVPIVDGSEHTVRALKTIAISNPGIPIGSVIGRDRTAPPFSAYAGFINGVRICLTGSDSASLSASAFKRGCDVLVVNGAMETPAAVRDEVALAISQAVQDGELTYEALNTAAQKVGELRGLDAGRSQ
jgi:beta-glucosidase-like glycosyl hydrolase